jgi:probable phosphoglycerate mutase
MDVLFVLYFSTKKGNNMLEQQGTDTNLILIRHGESEEEVQHVIGDFPLTDNGKYQVTALAQRLQHDQEIARRDVVLIASPFERAMQTASLLAPIWNTQVVVDAGFQKWMPGYAVGLRFDEFKRLYGSNPYYSQVTTATDDETWAHYLLRVYSAYNRILEKHAGKTIVLVTHRGVMECSFSYLSGATSLSFPVVHYDSAYTGITRWRHVADAYSSGWRLVSHNDAAHLLLDVTAGGGGAHVQRS